MARLNVNYAFGNESAYQYLTNGSTTNDASPTIVGSASAYSLVYIEDAGRVIGSVRSDYNGNWYFTPQSDLSAGAHQLVFKSGNATSAPFLLNIQPTPITIDSVIDDQGGFGLLVNGGTTDDTTPIFAGRGPAWSVIYVLDNGAVIGSAISNHAGQWQFVPDAALSKGQHAITFQSGAASSKAFVIDVQPAASAEPAITFDFVYDNFINPGLVNPGGTTDDDTPRFTGYAEPNTIVTFYLDGDAIGQWRTSSTGYFNFTPHAPIANGEHSLVAKTHPQQQGAAFNFTVEVPVTLRFAFDAEGGLVEPGSESREAAFRFVGAGPRGEKVYLYDGDEIVGSAVTSSINGQWILDVKDLPAGAHNFVFKVGDYASAPFSFTTQPTPLEPLVEETPVLLEQVFDHTIDKSVSDGGKLYNYRPVLKGSAAADSLVNIYDNGKSIGSTLADENGKWSFTPTQNLVGEQHSITVGGNSGVQGEAFDFSLLGLGRVFIDKGIEDDYGVGAFDRWDRAVISDSRPEFVGRGIPDSIVTLELNGREIGSAQVDAAGNWRYQVQEDLHYQVDGYNLQAKNAGLLDSLPFYFEVKHPEDTLVVIEKLFDDRDGLKQIIYGSDTQDSTPVITGRAGHNIVIKFYDNGTEIGSTQAGADGRWSFQPELSSGEHAITAKAGLYQQTPFAFKFSTSAATHKFAFALDELLSAANEPLLASEEIEVTSAALVSIEQQDLTFISSAGVYAAPGTHAATQLDEYLIYS